MVLVDDEYAKAMSSRSVEARTADAARKCLESLFDAVRDGDVRMEA